MPSYRNVAFISYSHNDMAVATWLQRKLEGFRLPTEVHNDIDARCRYLRPVFRDQDDLDSGILTDELIRHLGESKYLILICSAASAASRWVSDEARAFVEMGRLDRIIPLIIPHGDTAADELFPAYLREYFAEHPDKELLGINLGDGGRDKALVRVISRMLNVSFDSLWQRHKRLKRRRTITAAALSALLLSAAYLFAMPVDVCVKVPMQQSELPLGEKVVLEINGAEYVSEPAEPCFETVRLPGYRRFGGVKLSLTSPYFIPVDTVVSIGYGVRREIEVPMHRDGTFATFAGRVSDSSMQPLPGVRVTVAGRETVSGADGTFSVTLPLSAQRCEQSVSLSLEGYAAIERPDETPCTELRYIMHGN